MKKFRQKLFTLSEGHYTGPKDMDKVPGFIEMVGKSALGGAGIGAVASNFVKNSSILDGVVTGSKYGTLTGFILKIFLNYLHNPMSSVKYQEIDRKIRKEFGIYRLKGITVGDTLDKRASIDERFGFNDRNVINYKLNFTVQDNQITMYTFGLSDKELSIVDKTLDYYCKKYFGMNYASTRLNEKYNSYSVSIIFTNYQVISNFIMELSKGLDTKINLLDNRAIVDSKLNIQLNESNIEEKQFSVKKINKYDLINILTKSSFTGIFSGLAVGWKEGLCNFISEAILESIKKYSEKDLIESGVKLSKKNLNNIFLENRLNRLHYYEGYNYQVGGKNSELNFSMVSGVLIITVLKKSESYDKLETIYSKYKNDINRTDSGKVVIYTYFIPSINNFEYFLKRLMSTGIFPNIYE